MLRVVWRVVAHTRGRSVALGTGMLVAAVAFASLTAAVDVNSARITGTVAANWRGPYDLVVLPPGPSQAVPGNHLVQVNYLSASGGGITIGQYRRIAGLPGVGVAAPLAIVGYVLETVYVPVPLSTAAVGRSGARVLAVSSQMVADRGLSRYPAQPSGYVYITPDPLSAGTTSLHTPVERLPDGASVAVCGIAWNEASGGASPFAGVTDTGLDDCWSRVTGHPGVAAVPRSGGGPATAWVSWSFPVLVAGIDPVAENALTGLGSAVTAGRYLSESSPLRLVPAGAPGTGTTSAVVPVLGSSTSFDGDSNRVRIRLLPPWAVAVARSGGSPLHIAEVLGTEPGTQVESVTIGAATAWHALLASLASPVRVIAVNRAQGVGQYWSAGPVRLRPGPAGSLVASAAGSSPAVWTADTSINGLRYVPVPPAAADTAFRTLTSRTGSAVAARGLPGTGLPYVSLHLVGEFNPSRLPGFSAGSASAPLASYRAPVLTGADAASRRALGNASLEPDGNMAGYAQPPPLLYTTLAGVHAIEGAAGTAPVSSVRVRVTGLRGPVTEQLSKIAVVGEEITRVTGLRVVVMAGASPAPVTVRLPAGKYGRPALSLTSLWTQTGVSLLVLRQADRESIALFVLVLAVCALFLAGAAAAGVRGRRAEIGALRALGWGRRQVFTMILAEVAVLGLAAGITGAGLSAALITVLRLHVPIWRALLVLPVAALLGTGAGMVPAWQASRVQPAAAFAPAIPGPRRGGRRVRSVTGLAVTSAVRHPGRCVLAGAGLAAGVLALTVLLAAQTSFATSIGDSSLAGLVTGTVRGTDLTAALLTITLSAAGVADLTYLASRERASELAALAAAGWNRWHLARLLGTEAALVAAASSAVAAAAGLTIAGTAFGISPGVVLAAVTAALGGLLCSVAATAAVLALTARKPLTAILSADE
jgi:putative ABC transport system permease protein